MGETGGSSPGGDDLKVDKRQIFERGGVKRQHGRRAHLKGGGVLCFGHVRHRWNGGRAPLLDLGLDYML